MFLAAQRPNVMQEEESTRELRLLEELLAQRTSELEAANERLQHNERLALIGTLAAGIAHEINNPIGVIILAATNALEISGEPDADKLRDRAFEKILNHCARIRETVNSVRAFASTEPVEKAPYSLNRVVRSAVDLISGYAKDRGISCELALVEPIPEIQLVPREIEQVFVHLIRRAITVGDRGTRVLIRTECLGNEVHSSIRHCGPGLTNSSEARPSSFSADSLHSDGSWPGLATAREIVESYGGSIEVESDSGAIVGFVVVLPRSVTA